MKSKYFDSIVSRKTVNVPINVLCVISRCSSSYEVELLGMKFRFESLDSVCDFIRSNIG